MHRPCERMLCQAYADHRCQVVNLLTGIAECVRSWCPRSATCADRRNHSTRCSSVCDRIAGGGAGTRVDGDRAAHVSSVVGQYRVVGAVRDRMRLH